MLREHSYKTSSKGVGVGGQYYYTNIYIYIFIIVNVYNIGRPGIILNMFRKDIIIKTRVAQRKICM